MSKLPDASSGTPGGGIFFQGDRNTSPTIEHLSDSHILILEQSTIAENSAICPFSGETSIPQLQTQVEDMELQTSSVAVLHANEPIAVIYPIQSYQTCQLTVEVASSVCVDSGVDMVQPTPAVCIAEDNKSGLQQVHEAQASLASAFQQIPCIPIGDGDLAGPLQVRGDELSPLKEHSSSENSSYALSDLKSVAVRLQNSSLNNSASVMSNNILFAQNCEVLHDSLDLISPANLTNVKKILCPQNEVKQVPPGLQNLKLPNEAAQTSPFSTNNVVKFSNVENAPVKQVTSSESIKRGTYSRALAPPNVHPSPMGSAPECGVVLDRLMGFSLDAYAWAIVKIVGESSITFIGRDPCNENSILTFLKTSKMAETLVNSGIWLKGKWLNISYFQQPATKLIVSGVLPFIPDCLIIGAFSPYGTSVYPILRKIPAAVKHHQFKGALSYRREIYIIKSSHDIILPNSLNISFLGTSYLLEVSSTGAKCFSCGSLSHTINKCDHLTAAQEKKNLETPVDPISSMPLQDAISHNVSSDTVLKATSTGNTAFQTSSGVSSSPDKNNESKISSILVKKDRFTQCNLNMPAAQVEDALALDDISLFTSKKNKKKKGIKNKSVASSGFKVDSLCNHGLPLVKADNNKSLEAKSIGTKDEESPDFTLSLHHPSFTPLQQFDFDDSSMPVERKKLRKSTNPSIQDAVGGFQLSSEETFLKELPDENMMVDLHSDKESANTVPDQHDNFKSVGKKKTSNDSKQTLSFLTKGSQAVDISSSICSPQSDMDFAIKVAEDWIKRSTSLKINQKKRLAQQMLVLFPNLEELMTTVLHSSGLFLSSTTKGRKIKDLIEDIESFKQGPRSSRIQKRKQAAPGFS